MISRTSPLFVTYLTLLSNSGAVRMTRIRSSGVRTAATEGTLPEESVTPPTAEETESKEDTESNETPPPISVGILEALRQKSRDFAIDLNPRLCLCGGELVDVLIDSGVGRYVEFMIVEKSFVCTKVPSTGNSSICRAP